MKFKELMGESRAPVTLRLGSIFRLGHCLKRPIFCWKQAERVNLKSFLKQPRSPKKKKPPGNCRLAPPSSFYSQTSLELARHLRQTGLAMHTAPYRVRLACQTTFCVSFVG